MNHPEKSEYAAYYETYVSLVSENDVVAALENQATEMQQLCAGIPEEKGSYAYAEGKLNIRQLLGHIIDGERVFAYRALRFSRSDETPLAGFEENLYNANNNSDSRKIADLIEEFSLLRRSNAIFFANLTDEMWARLGTASDNKISVRAIAFIMVGHVRHHERVLRERYFDYDSGFGIQDCVFRFDSES